MASWRKSSKNDIFFTFFPKIMKIPKQKTRLVKKRNYKNFIFFFLHFLCFFENRIFHWEWANRREKLMKAPYRIFSYPYKPEIMIFLHFFALFSDRKLVIKNDGFFQLFLNFAFCLFKKTEFLPAIFDLKKVVKTRVFCYFFRREKPCFLTEIK